MYFPPSLNCHYAGTTDFYNDDKLDDNYYHVIFDGSDRRAGFYVEGDPTEHAMT